MPRKIINQYPDVTDKELISCWIDPQMKYWLQRLSDIEKRNGGENCTMSRQIRSAIYSWLRWKLPQHYRTSAESFRQSNERTGKIYRNERY